MIAAEISIKPLSANDSYIPALKTIKGTRKKTLRFVKSKKYIGYEQELLWKLPAGKVSMDRLLGIYVDFIFATKMSDLDNAEKPFLDVLQKKYGFNDNQIYKLIVRKEIVKKGKEFILFTLKRLVWSVFYKDLTLFLR